MNYRLLVALCSVLSVDVLLVGSLLVVYAAAQLASHSRTPNSIVDVHINMITFFVSVICGSLASYALGKSMNELTQDDQRLKSSLDKSYCILRFSITNLRHKIFKISELFLILIQRIYFYSTVATVFSRFFTHCVLDVRWWCRWSAVSGSLRHWLEGGDSGWIRDVLCAIRSGHHSCSAKITSNGCDRHSRVGFFAYVSTIFRSTGFLFSPSLSTYWIRTELLRQFSTYDKCFFMAYRGLLAVKCNFFKINHPIFRY